MIDNLEIAKSLKKTILYLEKILENFPSKEKVLKDKIIKTNYDILELVYLINELEDRKFYQCQVISKIKMLDFYLKTSVDKGCISYKKYEKIGNYLIEIIKQVRSWIKSEENK